MGWEFTEHHVRPNVFYYSPRAHKERQEVKARREEGQKYYTRAKAALNDKSDVEAAEKLLELAVSSWPDNAKFLLALADCVAYKRKDPERALQWYDQLIEVADSPAHRVARGRALAALGWLDETMADMESALAADPNNGAYLKERAAVKERLGLTFDAILDYSASIPLLREAGLPTAEAVFNRGYCQRLLGNQEEAMKDFEAALQLAPSVYAIKTALGCKYMVKRRYKDALDLFNIVMTYNPHSAAAANNVALANYMLATAEDAPGDTKRSTARRGPAASATKSQTKSTSTGQSNGQSNDLMSDDDDEAADMDAMLSHQGKANEDPRNWAVSVLRGGARKAAGSEPGQRALLETSLRCFNTALQLYFDDTARTQAQAPSCNGVHAVHENEPAFAHDGYLLILTNKVRVPGSPVIHDRELEDGEIQYNRGLVHLVLGNLAQAEEDFQGALTGNPTHAHYPHYRAVVHGRKGELREAVKWNQAALTLNPNYFPALYHLGLCLYLQSRNAEAIQRLDAALALQPRNWMVMEARGRVLQELDRHAEALPALQDALQYIDQDEPPASVARLHFAIAQSAIATHAPELLRSSLREARLNGKDPASVYALRGLLAHREGKLEKALAYLSRAIKLSPKEARFLYDRSQVRLDLQDWYGAVQDMSAALERLPDAASLHYSRGMALYAMQDDARALQDLEAAAGLVLGEPVPQAPSTCTTPDPAHMQRALSPEAQRALEAASVGPSDTHTLPTEPLNSHHTDTTNPLQQGLDGLGSAVAGTARHAGGARKWALPDALQPAPGSVLQPQDTSLPGPGMSALQSGQGHVARGKREALVGVSSLSEQKGVLRPDPRLWEGSKFMTNAASPPDLTPSLWYHLGICRARQGAWLQAAAAFERAVQCLPSHPALLHELAKSFHAIGDHHSAIQNYSQVLKLQPGNARALCRRGLARYAIKDYDGAADDIESAKKMDPSDAALRVDYRELHRCVGEIIGRPGEEARVWDLAAFPPGLKLPS